MDGMKLREKIEELKVNRGSLTAELRLLCLGHQEKQI